MTGTISLMKLVKITDQNILSFFIGLDLFSVCKCHGVSVTARPLKMHDFEIIPCVFCRLTFYQAFDGYVQRFLLIYTQHWLQIEKLAKEGVNVDSWRFSNSHGQH